MQHGSTEANVIAGSGDVVMTTATQQQHYVVHTGAKQAGDGAQLSAPTFVLTSPQPMVGHLMQNQAQPTTLIQVSSSSNLLGQVQQRTGAPGLLNLAMPARTSDIVLLHNVSQSSVTAANIQDKLPVTTIHHGHSPLRAGVPALANPSVQRTISASPRSVANPPVYVPPAKKIKMDPELVEDVEKLKRFVADYKTKELKRIKKLFNEHLVELFYLQTGGNMMDYFAAKKKPSPQLLTFLKTNKLDSDDEDDFLGAEAKASAQSKTSSDAAHMKGHRLSGHHGGVASRLHDGRALHKSPSKSPATPTAASLAQAVQAHLKATLTPHQRLVSKHSISAVYDKTIGSEEEIVERAKREAHVMQRIAELRKQGLWSAKRLPKVQDKPRAKAHWDYLLEEMEWMSTDFTQERKFKIASCRKLANAVMRYHKEQQEKQRKTEREEQQRVRRLAASIAREVKQFWSNIEKVVQYKQQTRIDEKRKKALDFQLNFIVDTTEKYSSWLSQSLNQQEDSTAGSVKSVGSSPSASLQDDEEFRPGSESDDEETIALAEEEQQGEDEAEEVNLLQKESEMPLEELLKNLPSDVLDHVGSPLPAKESTYEETSKEEGSKPAASAAGDAAVAAATGEDDGGEFRASDEESEDDEETLVEQEKKEVKSADYVSEIAELQAENELSVEDLYSKYAGAYSADFEMPDSDDSTDEDEAEADETEESLKAETTTEDEEDTAASSLEDEEAEEDDEMKDVGLDYLMKLEDTEEPSAHGEAGGDAKHNKEITDIAAQAQSLQPTGYTLSTTQVKTAIPFLLRHQLREYQHIGLDWLVTMYDKKLNGILADEMGLGKTMQTIAVLAHLACEKGIWGPHLIVVPTSVMLNWELEFKKWVPAFKILTYYGSQKERKRKRQGWTKCNAFHVCITSYKLVIQDHAAFRRKKWKYFILDEAQNIKNFKSQRWQMLLNFQSHRRLLLTGTPLQNTLMELWSLMHFLMPHVFASHADFKEWFANPLTGMIEGNQEYNENLIRRLHKVLRPFLLRRLKDEVEKQMPKKFEHVVMCRLSKRQRYLYDEFMSQTRTKEALATGHFMSVINILMQLRKVCNHPDLFDPRPISSPFQMEGIAYVAPSLALNALMYDPFKQVDLQSFNLQLATQECSLSTFAAGRMQKLETPRRLIEEIDDAPVPPPRPPVMKLKLPIPTTYQVVQQPFGNQTSPFVPVPAHPRTPAPPSTGQQHQQSTLSRVSSSSSLSSFSKPPTSASLDDQSSSSSASVPMPSAQLSTSASNSNATAPVSSIVPRSSGSNPLALASQALTVQIQQTEQGPRLTLPASQLRQLPGIVQLVQTSDGHHLLSTTGGALALQPPTTIQLSSCVSTGSAETVASAVSSAGPVRALTAAVTATSAPTATTTPIKPATSVPPTSTAVTNEKRQIAVPPISATSDASVTQGFGTPSKPSKPVGRVAPMQLTAASDADKVSSDSASSQQTPAKALAAKKSEKQDSIFYIEALEVQQARRRKEKLSRIAHLNARRCAVTPVYGQDLISACKVISKPSESHLPPSHPSRYWRETTLLRDLVYTPETYLRYLNDILNRFVFCTPSVHAPAIHMHASHPPPSETSRQRRLEAALCAELSPKYDSLHVIGRQMCTQFPDRRLIQYDCGKLQTLDLLLRELKSNDHRALIFTQMTRMLDVLENFLTYHGHRYLRLDGTTRVEQRQILMERFNADARIFCFILSTRSGGIGVNLTGADTVIFYDSDWNPTMDAQAQDRCHRIGQTRDVHIYRLISEKTVEENILKKANQKRLLGDMAIEGGSFNTAYLKKDSIKELFDQPTGLQELAVRKQDEAVAKQRQASAEQHMSEEQLEQALYKAEDQDDVKAARVVTAEQKAELVEFDETVPLGNEDPEDKLEEELAMLDRQLKPVERYAVFFLETHLEPVAEEELKLAQEQVEAAKKDWELGRLKRLKEEEEQRAEEEDEMLYVYSKDDPNSQVHKKRVKRAPRALEIRSRRSLRQESMERKQAQRDIEQRIVKEEVEARITLRQKLKGNSNGEKPQGVKLSSSGKVSNIEKVPKSVSGVSKADGRKPTVRGLARLPSPIKKTNVTDSAKASKSTKDAAKVAAVSSPSLPKPAAKASVKSTKDAKIVGSLNAPPTAKASVSKDDSRSVEVVARRGPGRPKLLSRATNMKTGVEGKIVQNSNNGVLVAERRPVGRPRKRPKVENPGDSQSAAKPSEIPNIWTKMSAMDRSLSSDALGSDSSKTNLSNQSNASPVSVAPMPFSNPNLVIRTRRASQRRAEFSQESDSDSASSAVSSPVRNFGKIISSDSNITGLDVKKMNDLCGSVDGNNTTRDSKLLFSENCLGNVNELPVDDQSSLSLPVTSRSPIVQRVEIPQTVTFPPPDERHERRLFRIPKINNRSLIIKKAIEASLAKRVAATAQSDALKTVPCDNPLIAPRINHDQNESVLNSGGGAINGATPVLLTSSVHTNLCSSTSTKNFSNLSNNSCDTLAPILLSPQKTVSTVVAGAAAKSSTSVVMSSVSPSSSAASLKAGCQASVPYSSQRIITIPGTGQRCVVVSRGGSPHSCGQPSVIASPVGQTSTIAPHRLVTIPRSCSQRTIRISVPQNSQAPLPPHGIVLPSVPNILQTITIPASMVSDGTQRITLPPNFLSMDSMPAGTVITLQNISSSDDCAAATLPPGGQLHPGGASTSDIS